MVKLHEKLKIIYPESYGAKALPDPRGGDLELAKKNSRAFASMLDNIKGPASYGGSTKFVAPVFLTGWYPIAEEWRVCQRGLQLTGKGPVYGGSGLKWFGDGSRTEAMVHLSESDFSKIEGVGFIAPRQSDPAKRLLAAIRTSCTVGSPQRAIRIQDVQVSDNIGYFGEPGVDENYSFVAGVLSGGDGSLNANDDFFVIDSLTVGMAESAMRVTNSMAVQWTVNNFRSYSCDYMYYSDNGGSFLGRNWYPNSYLRKSVIHHGGPIHEVLHCDLTGFDCEHMKCESFISSTGGLSGQVQGRFLHAAQLDQPRDFYWLKLENHSRCRFAFRDLIGGTSNYYGNAPLRHVVQLGPHVSSKIDYKLSFDNCEAAETMVHLWQPSYGGPSHRTIDLSVNGRRGIVTNTLREYEALVELVN